MQVQTTLTGHEAKFGTSAKGPWTRHTFTAADSTKYQTFKAEIANAAYGLLNQPVLIEFEAKQNGQYTNNDIVAITPAAAGSAPAAAPTVNPVVAPTHTGKPTDEALRIARSVAFQHFPSWVTAGLLKAPETLMTLEQVLATVEKIAQHIALGLKTGAGAPGAASSGGVGAAQAGVGSPAPAAPVATVGAPVAQTLPDDGIPY